MENKKIILIVVSIIVFLIILYLFLKKMGSINREQVTDISTDTSSDASTTVITATNTIINTSTGTVTPPLPPSPPSNQITTKKITPVYYLQLPGSGSNKSPVHKPSDNVVAGVTLPQGKTLTLTKEWNFGGSQIFYETTEKVMYLSNPSIYGLGSYYIVKKSDL